MAWGILGAANIALEKVIPGMRASETSVVVAIASRDRGKSAAAAKRLGIPRVHGSYEELLADPAVEAVYIPLPNSLHVYWTRRAALAGKHVLCEKPIAMSADEARTLLAVREQTGMLIGEAFMVRSHPQWLAVRDLVRSGRIGDLRLLQCHFSYFRADPADIRSRPELGGGVLLDIGCYPVTLARWLFDAEPLRVVATLERDPSTLVDRFVSAILEFHNGQATFTVAGQLVPFQQVQLYGTRGRIGVEIPFNAPPDRACRIVIDDGSQLAGAAAEVVELPVVDQYTLQTDAFASAIRGIGGVPVSLEDAIANMTVLDALLHSAEVGGWFAPRAER